MTDSGNSKTPIIVGSLISLGIIAWIAYQTQSSKPEDAATPAPKPVAQAVLQAPPPIPEAEIPQIEPPLENDEATLEGEEEKPEILLPDLNESDDFIRENILRLNHRQPELANWLKQNDLVRRSAAYIDGLARGVMLNKIIPLSPPTGNFTTHNDGDKIWLNAGNYERYKRIMSVATSLDMKSVAQLFHKIRPLLTNAFSELGYNTRQMDGIILQAIDVIIDTPVILEPIELSRDTVVYKFTDPELELLLPVQKLLLRTGPENTRKIQKQMKILKKALLNP